MTTAIPSIDEPALRTEPDRPAEPQGDEWAILGGLRFVLALIVLLGHATDLRGADAPQWTTIGNWMIPEAAVLAFLIVSGYSMAHSIKKPRGFYRRRLLRIGPLYLTGLVLGFLVIAVHGKIIVMPGGQRVESPTWLALLRNMLFLQGWNAYPLLIDGPLWTISVEIFYYALTPLLARLEQRFFWPLIFASSLWWFYIPTPISWQLHGTTMLGIAWPWLLGFYWYRYRSAWVSIVFISMVCLLTMTRYPLLGPMTAVLGMVIIERAPQLILPRRAYVLLNYLGELSYPLYTLHWPAIIGVYAFFHITNPTIWIGVTFAVTIAAYHGIDRLFRRRQVRASAREISPDSSSQTAGNRNSRVKCVLIGLIVGVPAIVLFGLVPPGVLTKDALHLTAPLKTEDSPIRMHVRPPQQNEPLVVDLLNTSPNPLKRVVITLDGSDGQAQKRIERAEWPPRGNFTIGENDHLNLAPGQIISIQAPGYTPGTLTIQPPAAASQ